MEEQLRIWRSGIELDRAFVEFADEYARGKFRDLDSVAAIEAHKFLMYGDLFDLISSGDLESWGFQVSPVVADGPVLIPGHCFELRPNVAECDQDVITASGWRYERVRIVKSTHASNPAKNERDEGLKEAPSKTGRRSTYGPARDVLRELHEADPSTIKMPAERLLEKFVSLYRQRAREHGHPEILISSRTLRDHLKRFRKELEETGRS
ncbi:hypothetical protein [Acidisoma sp. S159]|uniref:hypothetical protein n=1 Tax=Acidisoma sp. S159 TaxID=1747225 RepID=UPI00131ABB0C|nr:hypothetical protein [Acidisoma sp. S159]